jgi:pimeloyl-ACP methyl ester carboxylesterase
MRTLKSKGAALLALALTAGAASTALGAPDRSVRIDAGKGQLHGALRTPAGFVRGPAVLMIAGSGPTDQDGDSTIAGVKPGTLRLLADGLEAAGVPSLRFDKRGIGASKAAGGAEADLRFDDLVKDAAAWAAFLGRQPGVTCVVIFGHSEGALIGAAVARETPLCGLVEASGVGRPADVVIEGQVAAAGAPAAVQAEIKDAFAALKEGRTVAPPPGLDALFRPSVQPYLISWLKYDPVATLKAANTKVLILQGDNDVQVSVDDARRLAAARPDARLLIVPGMNHVLKPAPTDRAGNLATYADPNLPLAPEVVPAVVAFVKGAGARQ